MYDIKLIFVSSEHIGTLILYLHRGSVEVFIPIFENKVLLSYKEKILFRNVDIKRIKILTWPFWRPMNFLTKKKTFSKSSFERLAFHHKRLIKERFWVENNHTCFPKIVPGCPQWWHFFKNTIRCQMKFWEKLPCLNILCRMLYELY